MMWFLHQKRVNFATLSSLQSLTISYKHNKHMKFQKDLQKIKNSSNIAPH